MRKPRRTDEDGPGGELSVLIATEVRLSEERVLAEREAARLIEEARRHAGRGASADAAPDDDLAEGARDELAEIERELRRGLAADERARRERMDELASVALSALLEHLGPRPGEEPP